LTWSATHYADFGRISKGGFDRAGRFATVRNAIVERQDIFKRPGVAEGQREPLVEYLKSF
jgi:hypothetical protein